MKSLLLITAFMTISLSLFAQSGWFPVYENGNKLMESIFFTDNNTGYVAAYEWVNGIYYPRILKTTNAGSNWSEQLSPQSDSADFAFRCVYFTNINTGFIAVAQTTNNNVGRILRTTNAGNNWSISPIPTSAHMTNLFFNNSNTGYAVGLYSVFKTTNGGNSWFDLVVNSSTYLFDVHFTDINTGYICGNHGNILKTTNGGINWEVMTSNTSLHLWGVTFTDMNTGMIVGGLSNNSQNIILRTTNAGLNWNPVPYNASACNLLSVRFVNQNTGWITGVCGQILKTVDGGLTWAHQGSFNNYFMNSYFFDANTGYITGAERIVKTTDGGGNFTGITQPGNEIPGSFTLFQNYPNPFNPSTKITFSLPNSGNVKLTVYDLLGKEITSLVDEQLNAGTYEVDWNASEYPSGVYFYTLISGGFRQTKKMLLVK